MPRYFFNMVEGGGRERIKDSEGIVFSGPADACKEAAGLARDIVRHGLHGSIETWKIVVTDENGEQVLALALSEISARNIWSGLDTRSLIAACERLFGFRPSVRMAAATGLLLLIQAALAMLILKQAGTYQTASAPTGDTIVAVRFISDASAEAIDEFLDRYKALVIDSPRPGGIYRLRIMDRGLSPEVTVRIVSRMMQEKIVEFAAAVE